MLKYSDSDHATEFAMVVVQLLRLKEMTALEQRGLSR
jgi:hypothetical protein